MIAVWKHELRLYFHSLTAYVFGAFLLVIVGIGAMLYNLQAAVSNFEYVLGFGSIIYAVIVPLLTLPLSTTRVVLGKYLALLAVFLVPLAIIACYPLIFAQYGEVYLPTSYGTLLAFFLMGAALIAVGIFLSSLTDNQGFAAGLCVAVILLNYFSVSLSEYVSSTAIGSAATLFVLAAALGGAVYCLTHSETLSYAIALTLMALVTVLCFVDQSLFEGLVPRIMTKLSLFAQLEVFVNGVFDMTSIVYYLSVAALFLFLSVQSLEKRRYN